MNAQATKTQATKAQATKTRATGTRATDTQATRTRATGTQATDTQATGTGTRTTHRPRVRRARPEPAPAKLTPSERIARGKVARAATPREAHAALDLPADRPDPVGLLEGQAVSRVPELVPIRYGRMLVSPFGYFRGAALPMASDLAGGPSSGLIVQACGDAHMSNFGFFASPERRLVFDVNDFDETLPAPWEWDVKRLAASLEVAGRDNGFSGKERRDVVLATIASYRKAMRAFAGMSNMDVWYACADVEELRARIESELGRRRRKILQKGMVKARTRSSMQELGKLTRMVDGKPKILADPPLIVPIADLLPEQLEGSGMETRLGVLAERYARTLEHSRSVLLKQFEFADMARKVVGVGSVGTRCWIVLMFGRDEDDPLFLQVKEAQPSVLSAFAGASEYANQGERVVVGQRLMQAVSDIFLGWQRATGMDGRVRDFYFRQLRDWKLSFDITEMIPRGMRVYGQMCGWTLARAHARSGDRIAIGAYLGGKGVFDHAIADFAAVYADQNEVDFHALADAAASGRIKVEHDL